MGPMSCPIRSASSAPTARLARGPLIGSLAVAIAAAALVLGAASPVTGDSENWSAPASPSLPAPPSPAGWLPSHSCVRCHAIDQTFSHPANFAPSRTLPADFPLEDGMLTCTTCHAVGPRHRQRQGDPALRTGEAGSAFCAQCHSQTQLSRADMHAFVLGVAHTNLHDAGRATEPPDFASTSCLTCHDGSLVTNLTHRSLPPADFSSGTHPFAIEYRLTDPEAFDGPLAPAESLDERIRLSNGRMDCGTCHSLYSPIDNLLVMENRGSTLCLSCHQY